MGTSLPLPDARRAELAAFLRARRASLTPADVGLAPTPGRRKAPGLRREEVAQLSGVGLTWYTWLEQGRAIATTPDVIDALARALRLDPDHHHHLRSLAGLAAPDPAQAGVDDRRVRQVLDLVLPAPACAMDHHLDLVAWNTAFATFWQPSTLPPERRNAVWMAFCDPERRHRWVNWEDRAHTILAEFHALAARDPGDTRFATLIGDLNDCSAEFASWWRDYEVRQSMAGPLKMRAPGIGVITFDVIELHVGSQPTLHLSLHAPHTRGDQRKLDRLATTPPSTVAAPKWPRAV